MQDVLNNKYAVVAAEIRHSPPQEIRQHGFVINAPVFFLAE
jgi:O-methyltransferase involved in polyketide biosynthesis